MKIICLLQDQFLVVGRKNIVLKHWLKYCLFLGLNAHAAASLQAQLAAAYGSALPSSLSSLPSSLSSTLSSLGSMSGGGMLPPGLTAQTLLQYQLASSLG